MKKPYIPVTLAAIAILSTNAIAGDLSYDYIQGIYVNSDTEISGTSVDGDGFAISGSVSISDNLAFVAGYEDLSHDFDLDTSGFNIGVDYHAPVTETTDVVIGFSVINAEFSQPSLGSGDDTGNVISAGIRSKLNDNLEVGADLARADIFDESSTGFSLSLMVGPSDGIQFGVAYGSAEDTDIIGINVRSNFR